MTTPSISTGIRDACGEWVSLMGHDEDGSPIWGRTPSADEAHIFDSADGSGERSADYIAMYGRATDRVAVIEDYIA